MSDRLTIARKFIARVRELGANPVWDDVGNRVFMAGHWRLPPEALRMLKDYAPEVAKVLQEDVSPSAEAPAKISSNDDICRLLYENTPDDVDPADWTWFVSKASAIIDARRAA